MVFAKLSTQEKDAFFRLLDEYFQSRPELFGSGQAVSSLAGTGVSPAAAASAVQRALATNTTGGASSGASGTSGKLTNPYAAITAPSSADIARAVTVGRVAAASLAFSQGAGGGGSGPGGGPPQQRPSPMSQLQLAAAGWKPPAGPAGASGTASPPSLPWRGASTAEQGTAPGSEVDKLVTHKTSVLSPFAKKPSAGVGMSAIPAFAVPKNMFGPPPVRRAMSEAPSAGAGAGGGGGAAVGTRATQPEEEEVAEGEWAEVLYDYSSEDPGDLAIKAGTRVFVTAKSSEDWWTGQIDGQGRGGLFPASYVKLL